MKPLLRSSVPLWTLLVLSALLKVSKAECDSRGCESNETMTLITTTTEVMFRSIQNCTLSIGNNISGDSLITGLIPGAVYQIFLECFSCCKTATTKPGQVMHLAVNETVITTSSIFVTWTKPEGNSSSYKVRWTDGTTNRNASVNETNMNITGLTAGVQYNISVAAVADDGWTEGEESSVSQYTKPEVVRNLTVTQITTSSISVIWTEPEGNSSFYRVQWTDGNVTDSDNVTETHINITNLTAGVQYEISVTAMAGDGSTAGRSEAVSKYTKPEVVRNLTVTQITTSSISVIWTEPEGNSSFYRVQWTDGNVTDSDNVTETHKNITNLTAGVQYEISVTAVAGDGSTAGRSEAVSKYTKPEVVRNLSVPQITTSSVFLTWTEPVGESSFYRVQWTGRNLNQSDTVNETYINITELTAGAQYTFTVTTVAGDGKTFGKAKTVSLYTKPEVVRNLTVTQITTSSISVIWTEPEGNSSFYRVQWTDGNVTDSDNVTETHKNITNLTAGVQYEISVTAVAGDGSTAGRSEAVSKYTKPEVVRNLSVPQITTSSVFLTWTEPVGESSFYRVQWTGRNLNQSDTVNETYINITELTAGAQYTFTVTTVAGDGKTFGKAKTVSLYTKPEVVRNLTVTQITTSSISVIWTEPEGNSSFYRVQWTDGNVTDSDNVTETHKNITNLTAGVQYEISVTAVAGDGSTAGRSEAVSKYTKPEVVRNLTVTQITTSSISVIWTEPEGNSSFYRVQWTDGNVTDSDNVTETHKNITNLTAGVQYEISVTAVAGDGSTAGRSEAVSKYTRPGKIVRLDYSTNTSSISLNWTSPPGEVFMYKVEWHNGGATMSRFTHSTSAVLSDLLAGTHYTITVIAIAGDNHTDGEGYTSTVVTKPDKVRNLSITEVTKSSVSLDWIQPEGNATSYIVQWTARGDTPNNTTTDTSFTISSLVPGYQYNITVAAVAVNPSNIGEGTLKTTFTEPEKPENIGITARGTNYLNISWTLPEGRVDYYVVNISNEGLPYLYSIKTSVNTAHLTGLHPGRIYFITVTSVAGNFMAVSDQASFATEPTPPGPINISQRTNSSLHLRWATPASMEGAPDTSYIITFQPEGGAIQTENSSVNNKELSSLSSGTSYNITVQTVGPQSLRSTLVHNSGFTLPNPVLNLEASPQSNTSIVVKWSDPQGVQPYYTYLVQTYSTAGTLFNETVSNNSTDVPSLEPGTRYDVSVTTIAATGSESTVEQTFSYTMPNAVTELTVEDVNTTAIRLTWLRQSDHKPSYSYLVIVFQDVRVFKNYSTKNETYTFVDLTPGELYTFDVFTVVEGVRSTVKSISTHARPEAVSNITAIGNTTTMLVSWTQADGQVASYSVLLYKDAQVVESDTGLSNATVYKLFLNLTPGVLYCAKVVTKSGPFENNSSEVCNATFPNPPGPIMVESQTVKSINFTWPSPEDMDHNQYNFTVSSFNGSSLTGNNWFLLDNLQSGSPYNISVVTVGVMNYESTAVTTENYTRPYPVTMLRQTEITTSEVTLEWEQPESKPDYSYVVQTTNGSFPVSKTVFNRTTTIRELLSGSNYSFTVTTQTADGTQADPRTVSYFTRPYSVGSLEAETLNTTAVRLVWTKPPQYKSDYTYRLETSGCGSKNKTFAGVDAEISELTPGTNCTFCVSVRAADDTEGQARCTSQYTKPEAVQPSISSQGSNSSIRVSWAKPFGNVEHYKVYLNSSFTSPEEEKLDSTNTSFLFDSLLAGRLYTAVVITNSGPFNASSEFVTSATFPNPPGPIDILQKTTSSIDIRWGEAPLMSGASFYYQLTNLSLQGGEYIRTNNTSHTFSPLLSGTSYNISVATVGVMGFESEKVQIHMVTTRPFNVKLLTASPAEENITVRWAVPDQYKESYQYNLTWQSSDGPIDNKLALENQSVIERLVPGTRYNISVTTETSDGTKGAPRWISDCTNASPVTDLQCKGTNTTNAKVILSWSKPKGQHSGFQVTVNDDEIIKSTSTCCNYTVPNLRHHTEYTLTVETQSCGRPSTPVSLPCQTGITNPPIPENSLSLVARSNTAHDRFTLQINSSLLNNINGPVTHVGVLVTKKQPDDTSNLIKYLGKTYRQWKAGDTPVYLATVRENELQTRSGESNLIIEVGDETTWEGYTNGVLDANGKYRYAIVLFTALNLQDKLVNYQESLVSITPISPAFTLPTNPVLVIGIAVGVTLTIFFVLFIILIGFIIYWKRLSKTETSDIQIHSMRSVPVRVEDYEAYYKKQRADSNCGFAEEFEDLKLVGTAQSKTHALTLENKPKNRYNNVLPYDSSRVKLSIIHGSPYDDYINANYMPGYNSRKEFIAAQGPLPTTVNEFWRMIWEKNVQTLVMLTRCNEQGRVKCEQYWAPGIKHFDNITVTTTSEIPLEDWTIRDFDIKNVKTAETRSVRHFHFTAWPDHGVPQTTELLISFRHLVREHMDQYSRHSPTVVHCSAGVGRTGTFIAIDHLIYQIEREYYVDVYGIVHDLRMHRPLMVQTEDQYVFLNQCAMDIIRSRTGTNVDLIYQNTAALSIYENVEPKKGYPKNGFKNSKV
ncbi:receptor-type tyrosine-protein phosphatase eta isoform X8 [Epinephelus lanceolatus]